MFPQQYDGAVQCQDGNLERLCTWVHSCIISLHLHIRHPLYSAAFLMMWCFPISTSSNVLLSFPVSVSLFPITMPPAWIICILHSNMQIIMNTRLGTLLSCITISCKILVHYDLNYSLSSTSFTFTEVPVRLR